MTKKPQRLRLAAWAAVALAVLSTATALALPRLRLRMNQGEVASLRRGTPVEAARFDDAWFDAARLGRVDILAALHEARYPLDRRTASGYTALMLAAYDEQAQALDYLLLAGADPCLGDRSGNTALMGAIYKGHLHEARRLMRAECPVDQANEAGETALAFAVLFGRTELFEPLVRGGADPGHLDARGRSALDIAHAQGNEGAARLLATFSPAHGG